MSSEESVMQYILNKVNSLLNNKQQISILQIICQWDQNAINISSIILIQFMFIRNVNQVVFLLSCAYFNFYIFQSIEIEDKLLKLALQNILAGQKVRNLYRFYFKDHVFIQEMTNKCQLYSQGFEIKKQIYS
ncbi:unnamed protein product [Paramecium pentaurelia]|uniref:Uncharacterized protein n=1 Tax=Paramecium pentaurelia TaxID=43138 RepID=A0A8S1WFW6_9CILI|nr:unnamed protein product [Paramecium pentaurelia]